MKKNKIITFLIILLLLSVSLFSGCSKKDNNIEKEISTAQNTIGKKDFFSQKELEDNNIKKEENPSKEEIPDNKIKENTEEKIADEVLKQEDVKPQEKTEPYEETIKEEVLEEELLEENKEVQEESPQEETLNPNVCSLVIRCDSVFDNLERLKSEKAEILPQDGIILKEENLEFSEGESVYDLILRELKKRKIHFDFVYTPQYNSAYIKGIANLYEFDAGSMSGWLYKVNGEKPLVGTSQYIIKNNDKIEVYYSCNLSD